MPFTIERNDLTLMDVDAIVVTANEGLQINGGVGLAVARAAGLAEMQAACDALGGCPTGYAVATPGFALSAKHVVHVVGPVWQGGLQGEVELLRQAYDNALRCADEVGARSIALPLVSAHTFGTPIRLSFDIAIQSVKGFLAEHDSDVHIVLFSEDAMAVGSALHGDIAEYIDSHYVEQHPPALNVSGRASFADEQPLHSYPQAPLPGGYSMSGAGAARDAASGPYARPRPESASAPSYAAPPQERKRSLEGHGILFGIADAIDSAREWAAQRFRPDGDEEEASAERKEHSQQAHQFEAAPSYPTFADPYGLEDEAEWSDAQSWDAVGKPDYEAARIGGPAEGQAQVGQAQPCSPSFAPSFEERTSPGATGSFGPLSAGSLQDMLDQLDAPFSTTLLALIDDRGMTDSEVYKRANMSRQLFSKIRSDAAYRPTKKTVLALAVALGLDLGETADLLRRAGFALSHSNKADVIVEYFIVNGNHDIFAINEALYAFDQPLL